jgi:hypothetical protein
MNFAVSTKRIFRTVAVAASVTGLLIACSGDPPPAKRAGITSSIGPNSSTAPYTGCPILTQSVISVGTNPATEVFDNGTDGMGIECSVQPLGADWAVNARVTANAKSGDGKIIGKGTITIQGTFKAWDKANPTATFTGVKGIFQRGDIGVFTQNDCTVGYVDDQGRAIVIKDGAGVQPNIAAGRVWASINCPKADASGGSQGFVACAAQATFRLENCDQGAQP